MLHWNVGDQVFVAADNHGWDAEIIETRESTKQPPSHYKVRTSDGQEFWALDFEISAPLPYDSRSDTINHITRVQELLGQALINLQDRGYRHDASKLQEPEKSVFDRVTPKLRQLTYGSDEYKASLDEMGEALQHHYAHNSHHPQHYPNGFDGMSLLDVLEMLADWKAATERHADGSLRESLEINRTRFGLSDQLHSILVNTARELDWLD